MKLQLKFGLFTFNTMSVFLSTIPENNGMFVAFAHNAVQDHDVGKGVCPWVPYRTLEKEYTGYKYLSRRTSNNSPNLEPRIKQEQK